MSVYKGYIHVEPLPSRTTAHLCAAYLSTYQFFRNLGHKLKIQILDNKKSPALLDFFTSQLITYHFVPPDNHRTNNAERAIQTFKRHFLSVLAGTHPSFPINHWHQLLPQAELTLNLMHPYHDLPTISAHHGIFREPYDFVSHPIAPCGTLIVVHNPRRETWDNFGLIGFYLGPALSHYRSYRCLISDTDDLRISDNIMLYPSPLVAPGASRFDQLLALTQRLTSAAEHHTSDDSSTLADCVSSLHTFLHADTSV